MTYRGTAEFSVLTLVFLSGSLLLKKKVALPSGQITLDPNLPVKYEYDQRCYAPPKASVTQRKPDPISDYMKGY